MAPARRHLTASTSSPPSVSVLPLASAQTAPFARFHQVLFRGLASRSLLRVGAADAAPCWAGQIKRGEEERRRRGAEFNLAATTPRCSNGFPAREGEGRRGGHVGRGSGDGSIRDGRKGLKANKKNRKGNKNGPKTGSNSSGLDAPPDRFSVEEDGKLFFPFPLFIPSIPLPARVEKALGCMGPDNAAAPVG